MAHTGQDLGLAVDVLDNPENLHGQRVFSTFDPDLKDRVMEFIRKERVSESMMDFLRLASKFYLASYERSGGMTRGRFPTRSVGEELEVGVLRKAKEDNKVRPRLVLV